MSRTPTPEPRPKPPPRPDARRHVRRLAATWMGLVLVTASTLAALILWHLVRRGRLLRENLAPPREVRWEAIDSTDRTRTPEPPPP